MWTKYRVRWDFTGDTKLCASVPADPDIRAAWIAARKPAVRPPDSKSIDEIQEEVLESLETAEVDEEQSGLLVFQRHKGALVMRAATVRAHVKDCARVLSNQYVGSITGERSFATRVINGVYHDPTEYWIPILRPDGSPVTEPDGRVEKSVHPRPGVSALKAFEFVDPARMDFTLLVLSAPSGPSKVMRKAKKKGEAPVEVEVKHKPSVSLADLETIFAYGCVHGYAGERGDGEGRYLYSIERIGEV